MFDLLHCYRERPESAHRNSEGGSSPGQQHCRGASLPSCMLPWILQESARQSAICSCTWWTLTCSWWQVTFDSTVTHTGAICDAVRDLGYTADLKGLRSATEGRHVARLQVPAPHADLRSSSCSGTSGFVVHISIAVVQQHLHVGMLVYTQLLHASNGTACQTHLAVPSE